MTFGDVSMVIKRLGNSYFLLYLEVSNLKKKRDCEPQSF